MEAKVKIAGLVAAFITVCSIFKASESVIGALKKNSSIVLDTLEDKIASNMKKKINEKVKNDMQK